MPLTPFAREWLDADELRAIAKVKAEYAAHLTALAEAVKPPLKSRELSVGLGLQDADAGGSLVGRFLSDASRNRRARPDTRTRALIDALVQGRLFLAVQAPAVPGGRRHVVVADARDVPHMDRTWTVVNLAGHPVPDRIDRGGTDDGLFDLFDEDEPTRLPPPSRRVLGRPVGHVGLGQMRLSTEGRPDRDEALRIVHAALDAGVRLIDTADSYGLNDTDLHHGERLVAEALSTWDGPANEVLVVTKVGLRRPGGRWIPDGSPDHLTAAVHASAEALGVDTLPLVLLHVVDSRVPLAESLGALEALRREGRIGAVGICNVDAPTLAAARTITDIAAVQVEVSLLHGRILAEDGVVVAAVEAGIPVLAHRPLGGWKRAGQLAADPVLREIASRHNASPERIALAWLLHLSPTLVPLPGTTRMPSAVDSAKAARVALSPDDLANIEARFEHAGPVRERLAAVGPPPAEVVLLMGPPASGKTSKVRSYVDRGYLRLNRDERGGRLDDLLVPLRSALAEGVQHVVLDNTYPTRKSRRGVIEVAHEHGIPVRAVQMDTSQEDALHNAVLRMLERRGRLLDPDELRADPDPNMLPPAAITRWFHSCEPPTPDEGLDAIETEPFVRRPSPGTRPGLILDLDGTVRRSTGGAPFPRTPDEVELLPRRREVLRAYADAGVVLVGVTNQGGVGLGQLTAEAMQAAVDRTVELLDLPMDVRACIHAPKAGCWCRKPLPGLGVALMAKHGLDPARTWVVGDMASDEGLASGLGLRFWWAEDFFGEAGPEVGALVGGAP